VSTKTVLIVDDSATTRAMLMSVVESVGSFHVIEASSGFDALKFLPRGQIDLILTDINMPDINGLELISYIRKNRNYEDVPVFIISSEGSEKDIAKGKQLGANEYIVKPFSPPELRSLIYQYLLNNDEL